MEDVWDEYDWVRDLSAQSLINSRKAENAKVSRSTPRVKKTCQLILNGDDLKDMVDTIYVTGLCMSFRVETDELTGELISITAMWEE